MIYKYDADYLERKKDEFMDAVGDLIVYNVIITENYEKMAEKHDIAFKMLDKNQKIIYFEQAEKIDIKKDE